jgi:hypothetical protein
VVHWYLGYALSNFVADKPITESHVESLDLYVTRFKVDGGRIKFEHFERRNPAPVILHMSRGLFVM